MKETNLGKSKGITLIALVITIIVLLILAGVAIAMLSGENGILRKAADAKTKTEEGQKQEETTLIDYEIDSNFIVNNSKYKCRYGFITGITIGDAEQNINVKDKVKNLKKDLPSGYEIYNGDTKANDEDYCITGMTVKDNKNNTATIVVYGDIDGDGYIGSPDTLLILQSFLEGSTKLKEYQKVAMDINNDCIINQKDIDKLSNIEVAGIETVYGTNEYYQNVYAENPSSITISNN